MSSTTADRPALAPIATPVRYDPRYEVREDDERETAEALSQTMRKIQNTTYADGGHALRSVHAKSIGLLRGELQVLAGLAPELAQGLFAEAARYPVVMRFSTIPGDLLDDSVSTPRGLALKLVGVPGPRLPGSEGATTQNYVLANGPSFLKRDAKGFVGSLKMLAATTDKAEGTKKVLSAVLRGVERVIEAAGGQSAMVASLGGQPPVHPLGDSYFSQAPLLHGKYMGKVAVRPVAPALTALNGQVIALKGRPEALRDEIVEHFATRGGEWELCVQLCTDLETMPIEDAKAEWPEDDSPYRPVARIVVPPQRAWSETRAKAIDDGMAFSPWQGLAAHRPIGSVMRARRLAYEQARQFRAQHNGQPIDEPRSLETLPD